MEDLMTTRLLAVLVVMPITVLSTTSSAQLSGVPACLHDERERPSDRVRREQALALAKAVHEAQGTAAERTRLYVALPQLRGLPPTPKAFDLRLYTDGRGYIFSLKDSLDPCRYGIFSDEAGIVYEKTPLAAALIATQ
jgi:hypothetical protein